MSSVTNSKAFRKEQRCEIIKVHHPVFNEDLGKTVIITNVNYERGIIWAYMDKPFRYRINRNGRKVTEFDPRTIQTSYCFDELKFT